MRSTEHAWHIRVGLRNIWQYLDIFLMVTTYGKYVCMGATSIEVTEARCK